MNDFTLSSPVIFVLHYSINEYYAEQSSNNNCQYFKGHYSRIRYAPSTISQRIFFPCKERRQDSVLIIVSIIVRWAW